MRDWAFYIRVERWWEIGELVGSLLYTIILSTILKIPMLLLYECRLNLVKRTIKFFCVILVIVFYNFVFVVFQVWISLIQFLIISIRVMVPWSNSWDGRVNTELARGIGEGVKWQQQQNEEEKIALSWWNWSPRRMVPHRLHKTTARFVIVSRQDALVVVKSRQQLYTWRG